MIPPEILRRCVFLAGPTSVGKSEIALALARKHKGEIVCADAFQLYREFPVLSAQPSAAEQQQVPHHLYGTIPCADEIDAAQYAKTARQVLEDIAACGKTPFVVGGSGLYLQALISGLPATPAIDPALREMVRGMTLKEMQTKLHELDAQSLLAIDANNPRRVARRLELCLQTGKPASEVLAVLPPAPEGLRGVLITRSREDLSVRIAHAVAERLARGAVEEVKSFRETAGGTARQILGWHEITAMLDGRISRDDCREQLTVATRQYAKRQLTWFRGKSTLPEENISEVTSDTADRIALLSGLS
jgi:tRNA dimethylallyltransferase